MGLFCCLIKKEKKYSVECRWDNGPVKW